jgi:hypothetical protein
MKAYVIATVSMISNQALFDTYRNTGRDDMLRT